jgi:hypothetical protein
MASEITGLKDIYSDPNVDEKVIEVYRKLNEFATCRQRKDWEKQHKECWDAIANKFWTDEELRELSKQGMPGLTINKCNKGVQGSAAIVTDQKPEVKFLPIGSDDLWVAEILKRGHDYTWHKNNGSDMTYEWVEETKVSGMGFAEAMHDQTKGLFGSLRNNIVDPRYVYWSKDSEARDLSDSDIIKARLRTREYITQTYPNIPEDEIFVTTGIDQGDDYDKSSGLIGKDNYAEGEQEGLPGKYTKRKKDIWEIEAWILKREAVDIAVIFNETDQMSIVVIVDENNKDEIPDENIIKDKIIERRYQRIIVGKKLVEENINPYGTDSDGNPILPIIPLPGQKTKNGFPMSPTAYAKDINKEKCKRRTQFIASASKNISPPLIQPKNMVDWKGNPGNPGAVGNVDKSSPFQPHYIQAGNMNISQFIQLEQEANQDIDDQYDLHDVMRGKEPASSSASGRMVLALQDMGGTMSKPFLRRLESSLVALAKVNMAIMLNHWPRQMWERLIEKTELEGGFAPEGTDEAKSLQQQGQQQEGFNITPEDAQISRDKLQQTINNKWLQALEKIRPSDMSKPPGISLLDIDVRMTAGSSMPTNRIAKSEIAMEMYKNGLFDRRAALMYMDDPNTETIVKRMEQQEAQLAQMQALGKKR